MEASEARMAKRSGHAVSVGQDARRERPATGHGQPRAAASPQAYPPARASSTSGLTIEPVAPPSVHGRVFSENAGPAMSI